MIAQVSKSLTIPLIVGGGIKSPADAKAKVFAGADFIVVGNALENPENDSLLKEIISAIS
jgi:putative glycerol-1-phosphate prenyltransferase